MGRMGRIRTSWRLLVTALGLLGAGLLAVAVGPGPTHASPAWPGKTSPPRVFMPLVVRVGTGSAASERVPADEYYTKQWALETVNGPGAWALSTGHHTVIAVLDTGVDPVHPDLRDKVLADQGWDFVNHRRDASDDHGHGTHVAGIAAAATDNGIGIAGMGWDARILPLKVLDRSGQGYLSDVAAAISYAADAGADVINLSLAPETRTRVDCPPILQGAIDGAHAAGVVVVAAAGNNREEIDVPPANCRHVLGVAATRRDDTPAAYSSSGPHVSVAAPGGGGSADAIYSTLAGGAYGYMSGTSMATPHVAGLAALLISRYPDYSPARVASAILDNAVDLGAPGWDERYGCGRIDAAAALVHGARSSTPLCLPDPPSSAQTEPGSIPRARFAPGEIIVQYRPGAAGLSRWPMHPEKAEYLPALRAWRLRVPIGEEYAFLSHLQADPGVLNAELNYRVYAQW